MSFCVSFIQFCLLLIREGLNTNMMIATIFAALCTLCAATAQVVLLVFAVLLAAEASQPGRCYTTEVQACSCCSGLSA